jgi:hypothetical protein
MTDTTPVTDDDRKAHEWCNHVEANPHAYSDWDRTTARAIRAHVPAPPKSLSEEVKEGLLFRVNDTDAEGIRDALVLADRVENVVANQDTLHQKLCQAVKERDAATESIASERAENLHLRHVIGRREAEIEDQKVSLDDKSAEVERLTRESAARLDQINALESKVGRMLATGSTYPADTLPDPADVPGYVPYDIYYGDTGKDHTVGIRTRGGWRCIGDNIGVRVTDDNIVSLTRLVPDVRRMIDTVDELDALPVGSIVLDQRGCPWRCAKGGYWMFGASSHKADYVVQLYGPVTVIHEPMVDSARRS